eukprot:Nitzschia sp. Nitz4//scaffold26_size159584//25886//26617//NITZ4_002473-RA/size159584-processed-gene-0.181-mRNA-1//1//CDS//3329545028//3418//frame0
MTQDTEQQPAGECPEDKSSSSQQLDKDNYFYGFERSSMFERYFHRLDYLERWKELAIRPTKSELDIEDMDMQTQETDDIALLQRRCLEVRSQMNAHLPPIQQSPGQWERYLVPLPSTIPNAGLGLFYQPSNNSCIIPPGTIVCYYTGHLHSPSSSRKIQNTNYLMMIPAPNHKTIFVDPCPVLSIKARYINDPLHHTQRLNCCFHPEPECYRAAVVTTQPIQPGSELFVSYGEAFWMANPLEE